VEAEEITRVGSWDQLLTDRCLHQANQAKEDFATGAEFAIGGGTLIVSL
jgi:hypothetical protein